MKTAVVYVDPLTQVLKYRPLAQRFAATWTQFPGTNLHVIFNGSAPNDKDQEVFKGIPHESHIHSNLGWDIGAFQLAAETIPCDLLVCLGAPVHFHQAGWLDRMVGSYVNYGPALYGCWAYLSPNPHIRTTAFWCPPQLIQAYPYGISSSKKSRYAFEHGENSFTRFVLESGFPVLIVTRQGVFPFDQWHERAPGVNDSLVLDQFIHR